MLENGTKVFLAEWEADLQVALGADDIALALKDNTITLFVGDKDGNSDVDEIRRKVAAFNATRPFDQQIKDVRVLPTPLPRTATGKVKRYSL